MEGCLSSANEEQWVEEGEEVGSGRYQRLKCAAG